MQVLLLGAGASFDFGLPLRWELTAEIRRWLTPDRLAAYNTGWEAQGEHWSQLVVDRINQLVADDNIDYEQLLRCVGQQTLDVADESLRQDYCKAYCFLLQTIYAFLLERQAKNASYANVVLKDYQGLKNLAHLNRPLWIFSTNQDVIFELLAMTLDIPVKHGVGAQTEIAMGSDTHPCKSILFERRSSVDDTEQCVDFFAEGEYGINLVKLHGGLDIFARNDVAELLKVKPRTNNPMEYLADLVFINQVNQTLTVKQGGTISNHSWYQDELGNLRSLERSLLAGYHHQLVPDAVNPWQLVMQERLPEAEEIIAIGYRFGDSDIVSMLAQWLSVDDGNRLFVVDPITRDLPEPLQKTEYNIRFFRQGAMDFFMSLNSKKSSFFSLPRDLQRNVRRMVRMKLLKSLTQKI